MGLKDKLVSMREKVKQGITDTDRTLNKIEAFGTGMREANQTVANTFRTFADKPIVDYSKKERGFSKTEALKKPWMKWQKKVYQNMELYLDAAIDKVQNLSFDVKLHGMLKKWDDIYGRNQEMFDKAKSYAPKLLEGQAVAEPGHNYATEIKTVSKGRSR